MTIELDHIIPIPLKDRFLQRSSDVWNTSVQFSQGEFIKIKAPSGTGKTTLVHLLYKLRRDYEGTIMINARSIADLSEDELAELRQDKISIIFQDLRLFPNLTARENIELKRILHTPFYDEDVIDKMSEILGISHVLEQKAGLCSYGEQQRIAIARALIQPFELLIMDEPFSHLDIGNTQRAAALIEAECRKRKAGLIITDLDEDNNFIYNRHLIL
ncbi:MAG: ATP-binding cassette protein [Sediminibacterium sp.]|nr:ATP-binding cassette protein [Sediminibacterium sp.]